MNNIKWFMKKRWLGVFILVGSLLLPALVKAEEEVEKQEQRQGEVLRYNEPIVIDSVHFNRRLWTHTASRNPAKFLEAAGNSQSGNGQNRQHDIAAPQDHYEILVTEAGKDPRTKNGAQFFCFRNPMNPYDNGPVRYDRPVEIVSLYGGRGWTPRDAVDASVNNDTFRNGGRLWWKSFGSMWGIYPYSEIFISRTYPLDEGHPGATGTARLFKLVSADGHKGNVLLNDQVEIWSGQEKIWVVPGGRYGGDFYQLLLNTANNDPYGKEHHGDHRSNIWQKFVIKKEVAAEGQKAYENIQAMLKEFADKKELPVLFDAQAMKAKHEERKQAHEAMTQENETLKARVAELEQAAAAKPKAKKADKKGKKKAKKKKAKKKAKKGKKKAKKKGKKKATKKKGKKKNKKAAKKKDKKVKGKKKGKKAKKAKRKKVKKGKKAAKAE